MEVEYRQKMEYPPEDLRDLQLKSLDLFLYFKKICDDNNLLVYFCGGCCIGALRHQGFVPWDDDIDVFMPRADYEKLKTIWKEKADNKRYSIHYPTRDFCDHNLFITIRDAQTTYIKPYQQQIDMNHGIVLDILPLDGCPAGGFQRKMQKIWAMIYSLYSSRFVPQNHGKLVAIAGKVMLTLAFGKTFKYKVWRFAEKQMTKYRIEDCDKITELCAGPHYMKNEYPKEAFASATYRKFEGYDMPIPVGYDAYLKMAFGDYMSMPPKEKQVAHHDIVFYNLNSPYKNYKGIYYCTEEKK